MTAPQNDHDFRQLTGAFDRPIAPSPHFADVLRKRVENEAAIQHPETTISRPVSYRTDRAASQTQPRRRWVDIALAAALIIGMLSGTLWYADVRIGDDGPSLPGATQYAAEPIASNSFQETEARGGPFGGASDRSLVNRNAPGPTEPLNLAWSLVVSDPIWGMAYGDVVASLGSSTLTVQDTATGNVLWSKPTSEAFRNQTWDTDRDPTLMLGQRQGKSIALPWIEGDTMYWSTTTELVGVDLHTGAEVFRTVHTIPDENTDLDHLFFPWDMAVRDGIAYVLTIPSPGYYVLHAIALDTGKTLWRYEAGEPVSDWSMATIALSQLVVTDTVVAMQVSNDENSILALDPADGSILWQAPNALLGDGDSLALSHISAVDGKYLVLTHRAMPTGASDGTPNADKSLGVALYNIEDGYLLWTAREGTGGWNYPDQGTATCSLIPGWTTTDLYIPCSTDDTVYLFEFPVSGTVTLVGQWEVAEKAYPTSYDSRAAYLGSGHSIFRIDYYKRELTTIPLIGGEACTGLPTTGPTVLCMHDDSLGTYTLQAFLPAPEATPGESPAP